MIGNSPLRRRHRGTLCLVSFAQSHVLLVLKLNLRPIFLVLHILNRDFISILLAFSLLYNIYFSFFNSFLYNRYFGNAHLNIVMSRCAIEMNKLVNY